MGYVNQATNANSQTNEQFIYWTQIPVSYLCPGAFVIKGDTE